jgi:hypothetical protein
MIALTLDQLVANAVKHANSVLVGNKEAMITPFFHIQFNDRAPVLIATPWSNDVEKQAATYSIRASLKKFRDHVVNYSFISEAWMAHYDNPMPANLTMPRDRPDRRECVIINAFDHKEGRFKVLTIERDAEGRVTKLVPDPDDQYTGLEGDLHNLLLGEDSQAS